MPLPYVFIVNHVRPNYLLIIPRSTKLSLLSTTILSCTPPKRNFVHGPEWPFTVRQGDANQPEVRQDLSVMSSVSRYAEIFLNVLIFSSTSYSMPSGPSFLGSEVNT